MAMFNAFLWIVAIGAGLAVATFLICGAMALGMWLIDLLD